MAKCFLTGIEISMEHAYLLDHGAAKRELRSRKEQVAALERLLAQLTPQDSREIFSQKKRKHIVVPQRRLVCSSVASALGASCPEAKIFITWNQFLERRKQARKPAAKPEAQESPTAKNG